jgi:hypothetical protein
VQDASSPRKGPWSRLAWFMALWALGVAATAAVALLVRLLMRL